MWKSGGSKPESVSSDPPAQKSRFRGPYRLLLVFLVLFVALFLVFPAIFSPRIDLPNELKFGSASGLTVQVSNQNFTPLNNIEYSCELSKLTSSNGSAITDAKVLTRGIIRKIPGRNAVTVRCESAYIITVPLQVAEYKLTLKYRASPWPQLRTSEYRIAAQLDSRGQVTGWKQG